MRYRKISAVLWAVWWVAACGPSPGGGSSTGDGGIEGDTGSAPDALAQGDASDCTPNCTEAGARACSTMGTKVRECREVAPGCLRWTLAEDCAGQGQICDDDNGEPTCVDPPSCTDGIQNQDESDVDCGGVCPPCSSGSACTGPDDCESGLCQNGVCLECQPDTYRCRGNWLDHCASDGLSWQPVLHCDYSQSQGCDAVAGQCHMLPPIGNGPDNPTGQYYQFAHFDSELRSNCWDVDSFGDLIFCNHDGQTVYVYRVTLLDSDGDGKLEPNQHPENPDNRGDVEERQLQFVTTYSLPIGGSSTNELYVTSDTIYFMAGGNPARSLKAYDIASGNVTTIVDFPQIPFSSRYGEAYFQVLGYDEVRDLWFSTTADRFVFSYDPATGEWSWEFTHPDFAGSHDDGMEVVVDPNTGIPYVYVSDMTSDFIAQYHEDENGVWTQVNLFAYDQPQGDVVEGMGFGALNHFWCAGGSSVYEIGGGDLAQYTEPFDPTHQ